MPKHFEIHLMIGLAGGPKLTQTDAAAYLCDMGNSHHQLLPTATVSPPLGELHKEEQQ